MVKHLIKDLGIALDEGQKMGVFMPSTGLAHQFYSALMQQGGEDIGVQGLIIVLEKLSNAELPKREEEEK